MTTIAHCTDDNTTGYTAAKLAALNDRISEECTEAGIEMIDHAGTVRTADDSRADEYSSICDRALDGADLIQLVEAS